MSPSQFRAGCAGPRAELRWDAERTCVSAAPRLGLGLAALAGERKAQTRFPGSFKSTENNCFFKSAVEERTWMFAARTGESCLSPAAIRGAF